MNKNGEKVNKVQLLENDRCLVDFQRGNLAAPMTFDDCLTADRNDKVQKAREKTAEREGLKCDPLDEAPPFAYTDSSTVNQSAVNRALALTYAIFGGPPVLDAALVKRAENKETAKCQFELLKRADRLESVLLNEIGKAKRKAVRDQTVDSQAALEAKLRVILSSNRRINRVQDQLVTLVDLRCAELQVTPDTIFPGECGEGGPELSEIEDCVITAARCGACSMINAFDDLNLDCDRVDDQTANGSCP